ncbi:MAG: hypothetical protein QGG03_05170, partial [SAR324 cluster bacterium]|nr:hypothetical protein [SAR324 cluster bacterium]
DEVIWSPSPFSHVQKNVNIIHHPHRPCERGYLAHKVFHSSSALLLLRYKNLISSFELLIQYLSITMKWRTQYIRNTFGGS